MMNISKLDLTNKFTFFLKGVYLKDIRTVDEVLSNQIDDAMSVDYDNIETYDDNFEKIPKYFYDASSWKISTDIKCWHCSCNFSTRPYFIPMNILKLPIQTDKGIVEKKVIEVYGNFCSLNCAMAYIVYIKDHNLGDDYIKRKEYEKMLLKLFHIFNGYKINYIVPSPSKTIMIQYGGIKNVKEYQMEIQLINILNNNIKF
jgi:hypothetical protein